MKTKDNKKVYARHVDGFIVFESDSAQIIDKIKIPNMQIEHSWLSFDEKFIFIHPKNTRTLYTYDIRNKQLEFLTRWDNGLMLLAASKKNAYVLAGYETKLYVNGKVTSTMTSAVLNKFTGDYLYYLSYQGNVRLNRININTGEHMVFPGRLKNTSKDDDYTISDNVILFRNNNAIECYEIKSATSMYELHNVIYNNEKYIITSDKRNTYKIHDAETGKLIKELISPDKLCFHRINNNLFTGIVENDNLNHQTDLLDDVYTDYIIYVHNILTNEIGYINCKIDAALFVYESYFSNNNRYLITKFDNLDVKFNRLDNLFNNDKKITLLLGKNSPDSSIYRMVTNELFDEHLFGEILCFMKNYEVVDNHEI
jgi:hypothetical protein